MSNEQKQALLTAYKNAGFKVKEVKPGENGVAWELNAKDDRNTAFIMCWEKSTDADAADYKYKTRPSTIHARNGNVTVYVKSNGGNLLAPFREISAAMPSTDTVNDFYVPPAPAKPTAPKAAEQDIIFYNEKGRQFGKMNKRQIMNTSFYVGKVVSWGEKGGIVTNRDSNGVAQRVGYVSKEGIILDLDKGILPDFTHSESGNIPKSGRKEAEEITIGRVEVIDGVGVVYNKSGVKVGEVRGAGVDAKVYGGALLILLAEPNPKNAPYSHAFQKYETPAPPKDAGVAESKPSIESKPNAAAKPLKSAALSIIKGLLKK